MHAAHTHARMHIHLGLQFDRGDILARGSRLGERAYGPAGFLALLELHLGIAPGAASSAQRIVQYRECLRRGIETAAAQGLAARFYDASFKVDELGTSATLLRRRDDLWMHGFNGQLAGVQSAKLRDLCDVEAFTKELLEPSVGERLRLVLARLASRSTAITTMHVYDARDAFPLQWRLVLDKLSATWLAPANLPFAPGILGEIQKALKTISVKPAPIAWKDDGTVRVYQAETHLLASRFMSEVVKRAAGSVESTRSLLLVGGDGPLLDDSLEASNGPRHGFHEASPFRPSLQVLPLALQLLWAPLDFHALLQFLTHSVCPIKTYARAKLAAAVADRPGVGGPEWQKALGEIDAFYKSDAETVRAAIAFWVEQERHDPKVGAPIAVVRERVAGLVEFFRLRLASDDKVASSAFYAAYSQSKACLDAIAELELQRVTHLRPRQVEQLVTQSTAHGKNPGLHAEAGCMQSIFDPSCAVASVNKVYWWQLAMPVMPHHSPWSKKELTELRGHSVEMPDLAAEVARRGESWKDPIFAAQQELILVLPPRGEEVHPIWQMLSALVSNIPVASLETEFASDERKTAIAGDLFPLVIKPLPAKRTLWKMGGAIKVQSGSTSDSFSSLEWLAHNPYQWALRYAAKLRAQSLLSISDDFQLKGNLAHRMVEAFFAHQEALTMTDDALHAWFDGAFPRLIEEEGATFLITGWRAKKEAFRTELRRSLIKLQSQLRASGVSHVDAEYAVDGTYEGGSLTGSADLVVTKSNGQRAVIDMKWAGKTHAARLSDNRHVQLAIYAELLYRKDPSTAKPAVAYYILSDAKLFAQDLHFFTQAQLPPPSKDEQEADVWSAFMKTCAWRRSQLGLGEIALVTTESERDRVNEEDLPKPGYFAVELLKQDYNPYVSLAGWEAHQ